MAPKKTCLPHRPTSPEGLIETDYSIGQDNIECSVGPFGFDWFFIGAADIFAILYLVLVVSPYGEVRLGDKVDSPAPQRVFWCLFEGIVAIVLLLSAGGLSSLQSMVISTG